MEATMMEAVVPRYTDEDIRSLVHDNIVDPQVEADLTSMQSEVRGEQGAAAAGVPLHRAGAAAGPGGLHRGNRSRARRRDGGGGGRPRARR